MADSGLLAAAHIPNGQHYGDDRAIDLTGSPLLGTRSPAQTTLWREPLDDDHILQPATGPLRRPSKVLSTPDAVVLAAADADAHPVSRSGSAASSTHLPAATRFAELLPDRLQPCQIPLVTSAIQLHPVRCASTLARQPAAASDTLPAAPAIVCARPAVSDLLDKIPAQMVHLAQLQLISLHLRQ